MAEVPQARRRRCTPAAGSWRAVPRRRVRRGGPRPLARGDAGGDRRGERWPPRCRRLRGPQCPRCARRSPRLARILAHAGLEGRRAGE